MSVELPPLRLRRNEERRINAGHAWVFSNEVDVSRTPLTAFEPGDQVLIEDSRGAAIGTGYVNPRSLICARLVSRDAGLPLDRDLLVDRLIRALALRKALFDEPYYRLAFGEGDGLPGLVVDRFGDVLVAQITTAGMERVRDDVVAALTEVIQPAGILLRNDSSVRTLEGLDLTVETVMGVVPERGRVQENGAIFEVPLAAGQKTGWFYDHRLNRARVQRYARGRTVLDIFSYVGGWGIQAAVAGAERVVCVDSSAPALAELSKNAILNGVEDRVEPMQGDAFEVLRELKSSGKRFDVIILDPPAFIKRKKDLRQGERAYLQINRLAMELLTDNGILVSASCSYHLSRDSLLKLMLRASREIGRELQILEEGHQGPDHPIQPAIPETSYLKAFVGRLGPAEGAQ